MLEQVFLRHKITCDYLCEYLFKSPVFEDSRRALFRIGITAYLERDFVTAIHVLVPQIEATVRNLVRQSGGRVHRAGRRGGFQWRNLDELLSSDEAENAFGKNRVIYLRALLTDQRGWNIRNVVCHGLSGMEGSSGDVAHRLIHVLLLLALLQKKVE